MNKGREDLKKRIDALSPAKRELLEKRLKAGTSPNRFDGRIAKRKVAGPCPLSFSQQRMWFLEHLDPGTSFYNVSRAKKILGELDRDALVRSVNEILKRHEALRTTFPAEDGKPFQEIAPEVELKVPIRDLSNLPKSEREGEARRLVTEESLRPFDLSKGPLIRVSLYMLAHDEHVLAFITHHIVSDGWSLWLFFFELANLYNAYSMGSPSTLQELPIQYADFAVWQQNSLQSERIERELSYWRSALSGELPNLDLPTDRPRPLIQTSRGKTRSMTLSSNVADELKTLSRQEGATLFITLLAAFKTLLFRYTGNEDIIVGTPVANRNRVELEKLIGVFINTLAIRTNLENDPTFRELIGRVRDTALGAYANQELPFEKLVEEIQPARDMSRNPIYQVLFQLRNLPKFPIEMHGLKIKEFNIDCEVSKLDLSVDVVEDMDGFHFIFEYNSDLFDDGTISRMMAHFRTLLEGVIADPDRKISCLPILTAGELRKMLVEWNDTHKDYPLHLSVFQMFEEQAEKTPGASALVFDETSLTYRELNDRANRLASHLRRRGVGPGVFVGIFMERSLEMPIGILGTLKAGGAYVPLDPAYPPDRLSFMLEDTRAPIILSQRHLLDRLPPSDASCILLDADSGSINIEQERNLPVLTSKDDPAYVIYTSGSTGKPKGVLISHGSLSNNICWARDAYRFTGEDSVLQLSSFSFDASVSEFFLPLASGGKLVIPHPGEHLNIHRLLGKIKEHGVTFIQLVPSLLSVILDEEEFRSCKSLRGVICGGEALPVDLRDRFFEAHPAALYNIYGPTETTIDATMAVCQRGDNSTSVPIGRPIANFQAYVLDRHLQPVPIGVPGELHIAGAGLAKGYLNRPSLTAERFIPNPFGNQKKSRLYKTGDLVRFRADGDMEFLGRLDHQVKIRGFRIELSEIEGVMRDHPGVRDVIVVARGDLINDKRLIAYIIPNGDASNVIGEMKNYLREKLPEYMVPAAFLSMDAFPHTPAGKVNRRALPDPEEVPATGRGSSSAAPRSELEARLLAIWEKVMGRKPIGVEDNFFDIGGHSLLAVQLFARIRKEMGMIFPLTVIFQAPTVRELAEALREGESMDSESHIVPIQPSGSRPPFFCVHPHDGTIIRFYDLAVLLGQDQPFYGIRALQSFWKSPSHTRIEDMAAAYLREIRQIQNVGPYYLGGHCFGGKIAYEMARQLHDEGEEVAFLALIDIPAPGYINTLRKNAFSQTRLGMIMNAIARFWSNITLLQTREIGPYIIGAGGKKVSQAVLVASSWMKRLLRNMDILNVEPEPGKRVEMDMTVGGIFPEMDMNELMEEYVPGIYPGSATLFRPEKYEPGVSPNGSWGWDRLLQGDLEVRVIPGYSQTLYFQKRFGLLAEELKSSLEMVHRREEWRSTGGSSWGKDLDQRISS